MLQEKFFKRFLNIILISTQLFGFWPYVFDSSERLFKHSKVIFIYSSAMVIGINTAYFICFKNLFGVFLNVFNSYGAKVTLMYCIICTAVISALIHLIQIFNLNKLNDIFVKSKHLMQKLNQVIKMDEVNYLSELLLFTVKAFVIQCFRMYLSYTKLASDPISMIFGYIIPDLMITIMANNFYGAMLIVYVYLKQMNKNIYDVTVLANEINASDKKKLQKIDTFCNLSDRINELATYHLRLCFLTRDVCGTLSFHITAWIMHKVCVILVQLFLIYVLVVIFVFRGSRDHLIATLITVVELSLTIAELLLISKSCNDLSYEVNIF